MLLLHFQICGGADNVRQAGVEKLKVKEELYKNIFVTQDASEQIVPLEDALLLNQPGVRRELIMDVLNDDPGEYMELLKKARMNDDVEVVHYAITAMVELSKDYDYRLQQIERRYARQPEDPAVLAEYCDFLEEYLEQGILEAQMNMDFTEEIFCVTKEDISEIYSSIKPELNGEKKSEKIHLLPNQSEGLVDCKKTTEPDTTEHKEWESQARRRRW